MVRLRKGPVCRGTLTDGSPCEARVDSEGERCHACLERLVTSSDVYVRRQLARDHDLAPHLFPVLAADTDIAIRRSIAERDDCPLVTLQRLERDEDPVVQAAATTSLSAALTPRAYTSKVFSEEDLDALSASAWVCDDEDVAFPAEVAPSRPAVARVQRVRTERPPAGHRLSAGPRGSGEQARASISTAGLADVLSRLDSLGTRLSELQDTLVATGDRLEAMGRHLGTLAIDMGAEPSLSAAATPPALDPGPPVSADLLPVRLTSALPAPADLSAAAAALLALPEVIRRHRLALGLVPGQTAPSRAPLTLVLAHPAGVRSGTAVIPSLVRARRSVHRRARRVSREPAH
jgi:hypothetical protein